MIQPFPAIRNEDHAVRIGHQHDLIIDADPLPFNRFDGRLDHDHADRRRTAFNDDRMAVIRASAARGGAEGEVRRRLALNGQLKVRAEIEIFPDKAIRGQAVAGGNRIAPRIHQVADFGLQRAIKVV